jgi:hypothetical protein
MKEEKFTVFTAMLFREEEIVDCRSIYAKCDAEMENTVSAEADKWVRMSEADALLVFRYYKEEENFVKQDHLSRNKI